MSGNRHRRTGDRARRFERALRGGPYRCFPAGRLGGALLRKCETQADEGPSARAARPGARPAMPVTGHPVWVSRWRGTRRVGL